MVMAKKINPLALAALAALALEQRSKSRFFLATPWYAPTRRTLRSSYVMFVLFGEPFDHAKGEQATDRLPNKTEQKK